MRAGSCTERLGLPKRSRSSAGSRVVSRTTWITTSLCNNYGLRIFTAEAALIRVPEAFFTRNPLEAQIVLGGLRNVRDLLGASRRRHSAVPGGWRARSAHRPRRCRGRNRLCVEGRRIRCPRVRSFCTPDKRRESWADGSANHSAPAGAVGVVREAVIELFPEAPGLPKTGKRTCVSSTKFTRATPITPYRLKAIRLRPNSSKK